MNSIEQHGQTILELSDFVKKVDESLRLEVFKFLLAQELRGLPQREQVVGQTFQESRLGRDVAPQELIRQAGAESFTDKAIVLVYWLEKYKQRPTFATADLKEGFEQARQQPVKNWSDLIQNLESSARIMKAEKVGAVQHFRLTSSAIEKLEERLSRSEKPNK